MESKEESEINKRNREQYEFPHRAEKTSFANVKLKMKSANEDLSRKNVFLKTVVNIVDWMERSSAHIPKANQTEANKDRAFVEIMGRDTHGRVRTYGCGPCPKDVFGSSSLTSTGTTSSDKLKQMVESEVTIRMAEYEARREKEREDFVAFQVNLMAEFEARCEKENAAAVTAQVRQILESVGLVVSLEFYVQNSPGVRSNIGQVATTSTQSMDEATLNEE